MSTKISRRLAFGLGTFLVASLCTTAALAGTTGRVGKFVTSSTLDDSLLYETGGRVGVNNTDPRDTFHVELENPGGSNTGYSVRNTAPGNSAYSGMLFYDAAGALGVFQGFNNGTKEYRINNVASGGSINFLQGAASRLYVASDGAIGLGTTTPSKALDVVHAGSSGAAVRSLSLFSVVDIDAANGDAALRFFRAGTDMWIVRNNPFLGDDFEIINVATSPAAVLSIDSATGTVTVPGDFTASGTKLFTIDHPLDPSKTLSHAAIESSEVLNEYSGNVVTGADGKATVTLPAYFGAINRDPRYQLTAIGTFAQAIVSKKIAGNQFEIATSEPNVEVSWQVTAVRNDAYMQAHPFQAERVKAPVPAAAPGPRSTDTTPSAGPPAPR